MEYLEVSIAADTVGTTKYRRSELAALRAILNCVVLLPESTEGRQ